MNISIPTEVIAHIDVIFAERISPGSEKASNKFLNPTNFIVGGKKSKREIPLPHMNGKKLIMKIKKGKRYCINRLCLCHKNKKKDQA